jgi:hypothetical protein
LLAFEQALFSSAAVAALVATTFVVYPEFFAWTGFTLAVATGNWDPCFFKNTIISSLFMRVYHKRLGPSPKLVKSKPVRELAKEVRPILILSPNEEKF